jgi:hypothetical protein
LLAKKLSMARQCTAGTLPYPELLLAQNWAKLQVMKDLEQVLALGGSERLD